ncbi:MAG: hypothetical protein ACI8PT_004532 [Gammaproteobacteria bacterium]|jgi:hypothetical protein
MNWVQFIAPPSWQTRPGGVGVAWRGIWPPALGRHASHQTVITQFFAQSTAANAQDLCRNALITLRMHHDRFEQWRLNLCEHHRVQPLARMTVQMREKIFDRIVHTIT